MGTVAAWVERASGRRIDRVVFTDRKPGRAWNRTPPEVEQFILIARSRLRESSVLGEYGPDAIGLALSEAAALAQVPSRATIHRVLERLGALDGTHRRRRRRPPKGGICPISPAGRPSSTVSTSSRT